jgi:hypothetical protein
VAVEIAQGIESRVGETVNSLTGPAAGMRHAAQHLSSVANRP